MRWSTQCSSKFPETMTWKVSVMGVGVGRTIEQSIELRHNRLFAIRPFSDLFFQSGKGELSLHDAERIFT